MHGFGSHTFSLLNAENERFWVKFHLHTQQGIKNLTDEEAETIVGKCRESHQRDLYESIEKGDFPRWTMFIQVMPEKEAAACPYNPFDLTKVWFRKDYPLIEVGILELNRNPENYFAEVEQSAFQPGRRRARHRLLARQDAPGGVCFSYADAQRYRLGVNHHLIPVNAPRCPMHSYHRDGSMRVDGNHGGTLGYEPNSYGRVARAARFCGATLELGGGRRPLESPRGRRLLFPTGATLPTDDGRTTDRVVRQHGPGDGRRAQGDQATPHRSLPESRPGLRQRVWPRHLGFRRV